jgi:hypothetical protein
MSGENEVLPENLGADVWSRDRTYSLEIERTVRSITTNVQPQARMYDPECDMELYFYQPSHNSCFLIIELL